MAATRIISMHVNKGKTIAQCLTDRTDYAMNPDKTENGELISSYACDPHTADAEFLFSKRQYRLLTGREQRNDVIAYQVRQSFKPGEVTAEEANRIGYEFAQRFLKGKHAFIVATHTDKAHIHNHIIWNSTTLDCKHKFRDFLGSGKAVARLSDQICMEHKLSVIENPKRGNHSYNQWLGDKAKPSNREVLRMAIDEALKKKPDSFEAFLKLLEAEGYTIKMGKNITFSHPDFQRNIRMGSLGKGYTEEEIRAVISGRTHHTPRKRRVTAIPQKQKASLLIDIQAKLNEGKCRSQPKMASKRRAMLSFAAECCCQSGTGVVVRQHRRDAIVPGLCPGPRGLAHWFSIGREKEALRKQSLLPMPNLTGRSGRSPALPYPAL